MPLLTLITQQSLDEDYLHAAQRRAAGARRPTPERQRRVVAVVVAVFGILVTTAFLQTSRNADVATASRTTLISRVEALSERRAGQEERVAALRSRVAGLQRSNRNLVAAGQTDELAQRRLQVATGFIPVRGPGVRVTVTQLPDADENQEVKDRDLRLLVNGLYEAGAEAVAVNDQRMAVTSAIRTSGDAIEVNFVGIAPPYVVEAIGDPRTLPARFAATTTGQQLAATAQLYQFEYAVDTVDDLRLPSAPASRRVLRSVRVPTEDESTIERGGEAS
jgi:uncharacterized protein YlxW (UPF0749 family)